VVLPQSFYADVPVLYGPCSMLSRKYPRYQCWSYPSCADGVWHRHAVTGAYVAVEDQAIELPSHSDRPVSPPVVVGIHQSRILYYRIVLYVFVYEAMQGVLLVQLLI